MEQLTAFPVRATVVAVALVSSALLGGCASAVNPCKTEYGGLCTSPREMYGVTRNRDQVNPTQEVLKNQEKAGRLINSPPSSSENLPSISPKAGAQTSSPGDAATTANNKLPSDVLTRTEDSGPGGKVIVPEGPYATDAFGGQNTPMPLLKQPKVLRVWIAPYIGSDNTLHFPGYVYTVIQPGTWTFGAASQGAQPPMPSPAQVRSAQEGE